MPTSNPLDIQLEHDRWATRQILSACEKLTADQFARKFEIGPGSLQATITHMLAAMNTWTDTLAERPPRPRIDQGGVGRSPVQLLQILDESTADFIAIAKSRPLDQIVKRTRAGKEYCFTRGAVITHVTTHGMHHRAQCLNMLRHLGVSPLPPSSVAEWAWIVDFPQ
ncbi:MAG: DinB family protein [Tepidisphaeraceae bacterium]|jgi:uncharacterized damage-inducible protein DinB